MQAPKELLRYTCAEAAILAIQPDGKLDNLVVDVLEIKAGQMVSITFGCGPSVSGQDIGMTCKARYAGKMPTLGKAVLTFAPAGLTYYMVNATFEPGCAVIEERLIGQNKVGCRIIICRGPNIPDM